MKVKSFTLIELIVATALVGVVILGVVSVSTFFLRQINISMERYNMWSQINYTLDDMRIRCLGAIETSTPIATSGGDITIDSSGTTFSFEGEKDIYNISPDQRDDNAVYTYKILPADDPDNPGSLALDIFDDTVSPVATTTEVLIDGRYEPQMVLRHSQVTDADGNPIFIDGSPVYDEPNFITVTISAASPVASVTASRSEGIRFWFIDIVR